MSIEKEIQKPDYTDGGIDAGLLILSAVMPQSNLTLAEIAFVCGCSRQNIQGIEQRALKKLRKEFIRRGIKANIWS